MQPQVRSYETLVSSLRQTKAASAPATPPADGSKEAGHVAKVPAAPEKDPNEQGMVTAPTDPDASLEKGHMPTKEHTNEDTTPTLTPPAVAKTVNGEEKAATAIGAKAAAITLAIRGLRGTKVAAAAKKTEGVLGTGAPPNPHDNLGGTQAPAPMSSGPKGDSISKTKVAESAGDAGKADPAAKPAPDVKGDSAGAIPAMPKNTDETHKVAATDAEVSEEIARDPMFFAKLAAVALKYEDGRSKLQECLEREYGLQVAEDTIKAATYMEEFAKQAAEAELAGADEAEQLWNSLSEEDRGQLTKLAAAHDRVRETLPTELEKQAYDAGAQAAASMADAGMMGEQPPPDAGAAGPDGAPMGGDQIQDGDIMSVLDEMVQTGQITPEAAAQIVQALGGGAAGADPAAAAGGAGAPPAAGGGGGGAALPPEAAAAMAAPAPGGAAPGGMPPAAAAPAPAAGGPPAGGGGGEKKEEKGEKKKEDKGEKKEASADDVLAIANEAIGLLAKV